MHIVPLVAILFCGAVASAAEPKHGTSGDARFYRIECRIITTDDAGKTTSLMAPTIQVREGVPANIKDVTQTPFVTGVISKDGREEARITVLKEGMTIEATVFHDSDGRVTIDATIETSKITGVETKPIGKSDSRQCPRTESHTVRTIDTLALGEELEIDAAVPDDAPRRRVAFAVSSPSMPRHWETPKKTSSTDIVPDESARQGYAKPPVTYQRSTATKR